MTDTIPQEVKKTQYEIIMDWIGEHGFIIPARMSGRIYEDTMFGSETSKRCRELRLKGKLASRKEGKFELFYEKPPELTQANLV